MDPTSHRPSSIVPCVVAGALLSAATIVLTWWLGRAAALLYALLFVAATLPGWALGWMLFGRRHAAGWISGALFGYVLTAFGLWVTARLGMASAGAFAVLLVTLCAATAPLLRVRWPLVCLPPWTRHETTALLLVLLLVPALVGPPFLRIGARDPDGNRCYRAYFTADFLWHMALTQQLTEFSLPPANPYAADQTLNYYWTYFLLPAAVLKARVVPGLAVETALEINALCAGILFVAAIMLATWRVAPRAVPAAIAVSLAVLAASAEGAYVLWGLHSRGQPLSTVKTLNIDAVTLWFLQGLTVDGLPRSLWYTPQHAAACSLGLVALLVAGAAPVSALPASLAGLALAGAVMLSPFLGGAFALIYGLAVVADAIVHRRGLLKAVLPHGGAAALTLLGLGWCAANAMLFGAGGALRFGFHGLARHAPVETLLIALGPLLLPAGLGIWRVRHLPTPALPALTAAVVGLGLFYFVSLGGTDPVWMGWRAGQILLVTLPGLTAACLAGCPVAGGRRWACRGLVLVLFLVGLPTTAIDTYNAQDIGNRAMGPGFPWTVTLTPSQQAAFAWIKAATPRDAVVQMEPTVRGRATWTLIPTFAGRRMAAGLPISLVSMPVYETRSQQVRELYGTLDPARAWRIARDLKIDYLYADDTERRAFGDAALRKFDQTPQYFRPLYRNGEAAVYSVQR